MSNADVVDDVEMPPTSWRTIAVDELASPMGDAAIAAVGFAVFWMTSGYAINLHEKVGETLFSHSVAIVSLVGFGVFVLFGLSALLALVLRTF